MMDEFFVTVISQFPTFAGLALLAYVLRDELRRTRDELRDNQLFIQKILLILLDVQEDTEAVSRARSVLRSRIEDP